MGEGVEEEVEGMPEWEALRVYQGTLETRERESANQSKNETLTNDM